MLCRFNVPIVKHVYVVEINECDSNPCEHGATCTDAVNRYICKCDPGYEGVNCETSMSDIRSATWC